MEKIEKIDIAKELIEAALGHYFETQQYFASIQCAGAAEEILGRYVKGYGGVPANEKLNKSIRQVSKLLNGKESSIKSVSVSLES